MKEFKGKSRGKWFLQSGGCLEFIHDENNKLIAVIGGEIELGKHKPSLKREDYYNSKLICNTPEMLSVLKELRANDYICSESLKERINKITT